MLKKPNKKPKLNPTYPWKCDMVAHSDKKRQRKTRILDKSLRQARHLKHGATTAPFLREGATHAA